MCGWYCLQIAITKQLSNIHGTRTLGENIIRHCKMLNITTVSVTYYTLSEVDQLTASPTMWKSVNSNQCALIIWA